MVHISSQFSREGGSQFWRTAISGFVRRMREELVVVRKVQVSRDREVIVNLLSVGAKPCNTENTNQERNLEG